jgi:hypothetical protein
MSSTPRYQSRLFKTVQSQFHQWQDKIQLRWRQLKVATTWGAQLGLYPFYVIFQAGRWGGRVFQQTAAQGARALSAALGLDPMVEVDQPVRKILGAIEIQQVPATTLFPEASESSPCNPQSFEWQILIRPATSSKQTWRETIGAIVQTLRSRILAPTPLQLASSSSVIPTQTPTIQGIASSLAGRQLVLVAAENQILDILSAEQQNKLQQRIIWEMVDAARSHAHPRVSKSLPSWQTFKTLPIIARPQMSLPVRGLHHLMAWMQHQPIPATSAALARLAPAQVVAPGKSVGERLALQAKTLIALKAQTLFLARQSPLLALTPTTPKIHTVAPHLSERIGQWLQGHRGVLAAGIGAIALVPFTLALPEPAQAATAPSIPLPTSFPIEWRIDPAQLRKRSKEETDIEGLASQTPKAPSSETNFESAIADWANRFSKTTVSAGNPAIEIDAVFMGYDWHPLKQVLMSLDQAMAWVETQWSHWWPIVSTRTVEFWQRWWPVVKTQTVKLWQRWWPVIQAQWVAAWQYGAPILQKATLYALKKTSTWVKSQSVKLWQRGVSMLRN